MCIRDSYYLDDMHEEMGPTKFIKGSHVEGRRPGAYDDGENHLEGMPAQSLNVKGGDCVLFRCVQCSVGACVLAAALARQQPGLSHVLHAGHTRRSDVWHRGSVSFRLPTRVRSPTRVPAYGCYVDVARLRSGTLRTRPDTLSRSITARA